MHCESDDLGRWRQWCSSRGHVRHHEHLHQIAGLNTEQLLTCMKWKDYNGPTQFTKRDLVLHASKDFIIAINVYSVQMLCLNGR